MATDYQRIIYPERAEYLSEDSTFRGYRIFLDHWTDITKYLQESYEVLRTRHFSKALIIYGKQGCGKSVLANKLTGDFTRTQNSIEESKLSYDPDNIWHRICAGVSERTHIENIKSSTSATAVLQVENKQNWVSEAESMVRGNHDRACLVIADNCEKDYFLKGLLNISDDAYLQSGRSTTAIRAAAHCFVELCRTTLRGCLFIFFTNDEEFAIAFDQQVNGQHSGLVDIRDLKMPDDSQKEVIVRINVNRLNPFSYWLCIDRAGPAEKSAVWTTLKGADTFPAAFLAVDNAIRSSVRNREGRPARKCVLNAFVLTNSTRIDQSLGSDAATADAEDLFQGENFRIRLYRGGWELFFGGQREHRMLASEWHLKLVIAGESVVSALLSGNLAAKRLIEQSVVYHGPGTHQTTKEAYAQTLMGIDSEISNNFHTPDNATFWAKGGVRSHDYEAKLREFFPGYNTKGFGYLNARPDWVVGNYTPCSVLSAADSTVESINAVIRRDGNAVEFTAIKDFTFEKLISYLKDQKISNYVATVQEQ